MVPFSKCPTCGAPIPTDAPRSVCPYCALGGALRSPSTEETASSDDAGEEMPGTPPTPPPRAFGDYEMLEEIGRGGMGVVYKARQRSLDRLVAVKLLLHGRWSEPEFARRFRLEAEAAAQLDHPNIVPIHEFGEHDGQPYYAMRLIEGRSLDRELADGPMPPRRVAELVTTIARAVHFAHQHGVLHRDLKPHNVLIDAAGAPHLTDFGLAKLLEQDSGETQAEAVLGSPSFMAPEQAAPGKAATTTSADVYSLGAMLFMLLTGHAPFSGTTPLETLRRVVEDPPPTPRSLTPSVPPDLETICLKCLQKEPAHRYGSAEALADDLEHWLRHEPIDARAPSLPYRAAKFVRRHRFGVAAMTAILLLLCGGLATSSLLLVRERSARRRATLSEHAEATLRRQADAAREAETIRASRTARDLAERLLAEGRSADGLAWLVLAARKNPYDATLAPRLASALASRNFLLPSGPTLAFPSRVANVHYVDAGQKVAVYCDDGMVGFIDVATGDHTRIQLPVGLTTPGIVLAGRVTVVRCNDDRIRVLDPSSGRIEREFIFGQRIAEIGAANKDAPVFLAVLEDRSVVVVETLTGHATTMPFRNVVGHPMRMSPDGRWLLRRGPTPTEGEIWDLTSGEIHARASTSGVARWADFSPDSTRLVVVYRVDATRSAFLVYSVPDLKPLTGSGELTEGEYHSPHAGIVLGFSTDGRWFSIASQMGQQVFETATGARVGPFVKAGLLSTAFRSDREELVAMPSGRPPAVYHAPLIARVGDRWRRVTASPLDARVELTVADMITGQPIYPPLSHAGGIVDARVSDDGSTLICAGMDGCVILWDLRTGCPVAEPTLLERGFDCAVAMAPNGREAVIGRANGTVTRMRAGPGPIQPMVLAHEITVRGRFLPGRPPRLLSLDSDHAVALDIATGKEVVGGFEYPEPIRGGSIFLRPDLTFAVVQTTFGTWHAWELGESGAVRTIPLEDAPPGAAMIVFSGRGDLVAMVARGNPESPRIWRLTTGKPLGGTFLHMTDVQAACFSPDGRLFACGARDGGISIWDVATSQRLMAIRPPRAGAITHLEFSPNCALIAAGSSLRTAGLWDVSRGQLAAEIPCAHFLRFSSRGDRLLAVTDAAAQICDGRTGAKIGEPMMHPGVQIRSAEFSSDGQRVVTGAQDSTARIWDAATGLPISDPLLHGSAVTACEFSPDGHFVRTEDADGRSLLWPVPPEADDVATPEWELQLATICARKMINDAGLCVDASGTIAQIDEIRRTLATLPDNAPYVKWGRWILNDREDRPIAPGFMITPARSDELEKQLRAGTAFKAPLPSS